MITYAPFWKTIEQKNITTYQLIYKHSILPDTLQRLRSGKPITTQTLNKLCYSIGCSVSDILEYIPDEKDGID